MWYDYELKASDKLASRSWEGRIVGYTTTFGTYQVLTHQGILKIAKNPAPVDRGDSESESDEEDSALRNVETIFEETLQPNPEDIRAKSPPTVPTPTTSMAEPPPAPKKKQRTATEWE